MGHRRSYFATEIWRNELIRDALLASLHFPLLFPHGGPGWHLAVQYQGDGTSNNKGLSCRNFAVYRLCIKSNGYSLLHHAAMLIKCMFSTLLNWVCALCPCYHVHKTYYYYYYLQFIIPINVEVINHTLTCFIYW